MELIFIEFTNENMDQYYDLTLNIMNKQKMQNKILFNQFQFLFLEKSRSKIFKFENFLKTIKKNKFLNEKSVFYIFCLSSNLK